MVAEDPTATAGPMIRELMWVQRPEGTHLSRAGTAGGYSPLARNDGTNELETHATLHPVGDGEDEAGPSPEVPPVVQVLAGVVFAVGAVEAGRRLAPYAKGWWDDLALPPAVTSAWRRLSGSRSPGPDPSRKGVLAPAEPDVRMSRHEARETAARGADEQAVQRRTALTPAQCAFADKGMPPEFARPMAALPPELVGLRQSDDWPPSSGERAAAHTARRDATYVVVAFKAAGGR
jgi:hypothetical protein